MSSRSKLPLIVYLAMFSVACAQTTTPTTAESAASGSNAVSPSETPLTDLSFPYVTRHQGIFNGQAVSYTATVGAIDVADADGTPGARIVSTSYVADQQAGAPVRPVMFVFNGGPIAPSVYLHMGAFGPKRVAFADDLSADPMAAPLVDNLYSILDVCDLVYFDPAGTGFSRTVPGKPLREYFSVEADAQQTAAFIVKWLKKNDRTSSPTYVFGESYGTNRAAATAGQLAQLDPPKLLDGIILFGQAVNIIEYSQRPSNIMSYVVSLPTLAALGWYHGVAATQGADLENFVAEAWDYAKDDYLDALFKGNKLADEQLRDVANRLEDFTGVSADVFVSSRLRLSKQAYRRELFKADEKIIGMSDGRYISAIEPAGDNEGQADPAQLLPSALISAHKRYIETELALPSAEQYLVGSPVQSLGDWGWGGNSPFSWYQYGDSVTTLLQANPEAQVMVSAGYYDTMTTWGASKYLVDQETWPVERVILHGYAGGHMAYSIDASARDMAEDLREMINPPAPDQ